MSLDSCMQAILTEWAIKKSLSSAQEFKIPLTFSWRKLKLGSLGREGPGLGWMPEIRRRIRISEREQG